MDVALPDSVREANKHRTKTVLELEDTLNHTQLSAGRVHTAECRPIIHNHARPKHITAAVDGAGLGNEKTMTQKTNNDGDLKKRRKFVLVLDSCAGMNLKE